MSMLHKVRYDKQTTQFDPQEEKYWMHFLSKDPVVGDFIRSQMRQNPKYYKDLLNQVICQRCEKFAFHHKNGVMCPSCGHWAPEKTVKVKDHLRSGGYK